MGERRKNKYTSSFGLLGLVQKIEYCVACLFDSEWNKSNGAQLRYRKLLLLLMVIAFGMSMIPNAVFATSYTKSDGTVVFENAVEMDGAAQFDGTLSFTNGASDGYILQSNAQGQVSWVAQNTLSGVPSSADFNDGGDAASATRVLGNSNAFDMQFETNGSSYLHIEGDGTGSTEGFIGLGGETTPVFALEVDADAIASTMDDSWDGQVLSEGFALKASDPIIHIVGDDDGSYTGGIIFDQLDTSNGTDFENSWSIVRQTNGDGSGDGSLDFIYGTNADFTSNTVQMKLENDGDLLPEGTIFLDPNEAIWQSDLTGLEHNIKFFNGGVNDNQIILNAVDSMYLNIDSNNNSTSSFIIASNRADRDAGNELLTIDETGNGVFTGSVTSTGLDINGSSSMRTITAETDSTYDIGTSGTRFANGYFDTLYGDGSNLTGIAAGGDFSDGGDAAGAARSLGNTTAQDLELLTGGASRIHIEGDGSGSTAGFVGIGDTTPDSVLDITTSNTSEIASGITIDNTSTGDPTVAYQLSGTTNFVMGIDNSTTNDDFIISNGSQISTDPVITIDGSTGFVGIQHVLGGTAPQDPLTVRGEIAGDSVNDIFKIVSVNSSGVGGSGLGGAITFNNETSTGGETSIDSRISSVRGAPGATPFVDLVFETKVQGGSLTEVLRLRDEKIGIQTAAPVAEIDIWNTDAGLTEIFRVTKDPGGTGSAGLGARYRVDLESSSTNDFTHAADFDVAWDVATNGIEESSFRFNVMEAGTLAETMRIRGNSVGIGVTDPGTTLDVAGTTTAQAIAARTDSTYDIGTDTVRFANGYFDTLHGDASNLTNLPAASGTGWEVSGTDVILETASDQVGIGEASPAVKLDVLDASATGGAGVQTVLNLESELASGSIAVNDGTGINMGVETSAGFAETVGSFNTLLDSTTTGSSLTSRMEFSIRDGTNTTVQEVLQIDNGGLTLPKTNTNITFDNASGVSNPQLLTGGTSTGVFLGNGVVGMTTGGAEASSIYLNSTGLGIFNSGPSTALDVTGTVTATAFVGDGSGLTGLPAASGTGWQDDGTVLRLETTTDDVVIGATTIDGSARFEVDSNVSSSTAPMVKFDENSETSDTSVLFENGTSTVHQFTMGIDTTDNMFKISDSASLGTSDRFVIDTSGSVGIGTDSPSGSQLYVNGGDLRLVGGAFKAPEGAVTAPSYSFSSDQTMGFFYGGTQQTTFAVGNSSVLSMHDNGLTIFNNTGSVLDVQGQALADRYITDVSGSAGSPDYAVSTIGGVSGMYSPAGNELSFSVGSTERVNIDDQGRVTINAATSGIEFTVTGEVNTTAVNVGAGSAATPSLTLAGATTGTGLFSSGVVDADFIGFANDGTESMRISAAGDLGIGESSPSVRIDAKDGNTATDDVIAIASLTREDQGATGGDVGMGGRFLWDLENATNDVFENAGAIDVVWTDVTGAAEEAHIEFSAMTSGALDDIAIINGTGIVPSNDSTYDLGQSGNEWDQVYADFFIGDGSGLTNLPASSADFNDGGDTATANRTLGNNDAFDLGFETNGSTYLHIEGDGTGSTEGFVGFGGSTDPAAQVEINASDTNQDVLEALRIVREDTDGFPGAGAGTIGSRITFETETNSGGNAESAAIDAYMHNLVGSGSSSGTLDFLAASSGTLSKVMSLRNLSGSPRVSIGTDVPLAKFHLYENSTNTAAEMMLIEQDGTGDPFVEFQSDGDTFTFGIDSSDSDRIKISQGSSLGTGTGDLLSMDLSSGVVVNDEGSQFVDFRVESQNDDNALFVDSSADKVGILKNNPATALDVAGTVTATAFAGDGSALTGISAGEWDNTAGLLSPAGGASDNVVIGATSSGGEKLRVVGNFSTFTGDVMFGTTNNANFFTMDESADSVTIGETPSITESILNLTYSNANSTSIEDALTISKQTSSTAGIGMGTRIRFRLEDASNFNEEAAYIDTVWDNPTNGSEDARMSFRVINDGAIFQDTLTLTDDSVGIGGVSAPTATIEARARVADSTAVVDMLILDREFTGASTGGVNEGSRVLFQISDSAAGESDAAAISALWSDATSTSEDGRIEFDLSIGGSLVNVLDIGQDGHLLPGADSTYNIGATGTRFTNIYGDFIHGDGSNLTNITASDPDWTDAGTFMHPGTTTDDVIIGDSTVGNADILLNDDGSAVFNEQATSAGDFRIEGSGDANLFFTDASLNTVGIGTSGPQFTLDILDGNVAQDTVAGLLRVRREDGGATGGGVGMGLQVSFDLENATNDQFEIASTLETSWTDVTGGAEEAQLEFSAMSGGSIDDIAIINGTGFVPSNDSSYDLGASGNEWDQVYADFFIGDGSGLTGISGGDFANGGEAGTANRTLGNTDAFDLGFETADVTRMIIEGTAGSTQGFVGIASSSPTAPLDVNGELRVGSGSVACGSSNAGIMRWNTTYCQMEFCDGASFVDFHTKKPAQHRRIFTTSALYDGNLGGIAGANAKCQTRADAGGLNGSFRAFLGSTPTGLEDMDPNEILAETENLILVDGTVVNRCSLWSDQAIENEIDLDETGATISTNTGVWTGGVDDFGDASTTDCVDWTSASGGNSGRAGDATEDGSLNPWFAASTTICSASRRLFCVEVLD